MKTLVGLRAWRSTRKGTLVVLALALALVIAGGVAYAAAGIPAADGTIYGCYLDHQNTLERQGNLRVVSDPSLCKNNEVAISWNQEGPQGPKGDPGSRPGGGRAVNASPQWGQVPS